MAALFSSGLIVHADPGNSRELKGQLIDIERGDDHAIPLPGVAVTVLESGGSCVTSKVGLFQAGEALARHVRLS